MSRRRWPQLKVHRCLWSGAFPENSLQTIEECLRAQVARAEIDNRMLPEADFVVSHDVVLDKATYRPALLSEVVAC